MTAAIQTGGGLPVVGVGAVRWHNISHSAGSVNIQSIGFKYSMFHISNGSWQVYDTLKFTFLNTNRTENFSLSKKQLDFKVPPN
jgi:hypothetical protein